MTVELKIEYDPSHHKHKWDTREKWEPVSDMHCPACGNREVWHQIGDEDYYVGESHLCRSCGKDFTIQIHLGPQEPAHEAHKAYLDECERENAQRLTAIRAFNGTGATRGD